MMGLSVYIALAAVLGAGLVIFILAWVARRPAGLGFILFLAIGVACGAVIAVGLLMLPSSAPPLLPLLQNLQLEVPQIELPPKLILVVQIVLLALFTVGFASGAISERSWVLLCIALFLLAILAYLISALLEIQIPLHLHGMSVLHWILVGLAICFAVGAAVGVYFLLKTPSWGHLVFVLLCLVATTWMILTSLEIPMPTPWYMILVGVGGTTFAIHTWIHRNDPNVSISIGRNEAPPGLRALVILMGITWFLAMTWFGIGGLYDPKYVQTWMHIYSQAEKITTGIPAMIIGSILSVILFILLGPKSGNWR